MSLLPRSIPFATLVAVIMLVAACGQGQPGSPGTGPQDGSSGAASVAPTTDFPVGRAVTDDTRLCDLLGPGDFELAGVPGAGIPEVATDGPGSAHCVYAGESGATGGIELDAFVDEDPEAVYETIRAESPEALAALSVPGAQRAEGWEGVAGDVAGFARILVRSGNLVFAISAPGGRGMDAKLADLAALVVARGSTLAG
jgi:hypothetical protein